MTEYDHNQLTRHYSPTEKHRHLIPNPPKSGAHSPQPRQRFLLPEKQRKKDLNKKTLVLDLDETLVHSTFVPVKNPDHIVNISDEQGSCKIFVRY